MANEWEEAQWICIGYPKENLVSMDGDSSYPPVIIVLHNQCIAENT